MGEFLIIATYFAIVLAIGWFYKGQSKNSSDFIVGGRSVPWWGVLGSLIATEVSAATYLSVPSVGFSENLNYLQMGIGSAIGRIFVAFVFIQTFYKANCLSIYQYLGQRFGDQSQITASVYFIITRILASGVRLMIAVTGFSVITGWSFVSCLILFAIITVVYTSFGGIKAVIWTDCLQGVLFLGAGILGIVYISDLHGFDKILQVGAEAGRLELFRWTPTEGKSIWTDSQWIVTAVVFGFISTVAAMGTDQDMVQRLMASRSGREARRSMLISGFIALPVTAIFLLLGVCLFAHFTISPDPEFPTMIRDGVRTMDAERAFSHFMVTDIPFFIRGILITGVLAAAMSSLDSAMAALSSSVLVDLLKRSGQREGSAPKNDLKLGRWLTVLFACTLAMIAFLLKDADKFLWLAFKITGLTYGSLLGVFLLGMLTRRGSEKGNIMGMLIGTFLASSTLYLIETGYIQLSWTLVILISSSVTFIIGFSFRPTKVRAG